jgi:hypothetical protein
MAKSATYRFVAPLDEVDNMLVNTVIYIPAPVMKKLPQSRVRVKGTINGAPFALAVQYRKTERSFFVVSKPLRKKASLHPGQKAVVEFVIVSDKVEIPVEMKEVLAQDPEGAQAWKKITPGLQRGLCHYVNSVKNVDSRIKRALYLLEKVKQGAYTKLRKNPEKKISTLQDPDS